MQQTVPDLCAQVAYHKLHVASSSKWAASEVRRRLAGKMKWITPTVRTSVAHLGIDYLAGRQAREKGGHSKAALRRQTAKKRGRRLKQLRQTSAKAAVAVSSAGVVAGWVYGCEVTGMSDSDIEGLLALQRAVHFTAGKGKSKRRAEALLPEKIVGTPATAPAAMLAMMVWEAATRRHRSGPSLGQLRQAWEHMLAAGVPGSAMRARGPIGQAAVAMRRLEWPIPEDPFVWGQRHRPGDQDLGVGPSDGEEASPRWLEEKDAEASSRELASPMQTNRRPS